MAKVREIKYFDEGQEWHPRHFGYWCLGCGFEHVFGLVGEGGHHTFNMDLNNPIVAPSLLQNFVPGKLCHSYIRNGMIEYLPDCQHHLAGKTVELPDIDKIHFERDKTKKQ